MIILPVKKETGIPIKVDILKVLENSVELGPKRTRS